VAAGLVLLVGEWLVYLRGGEQVIGFAVLVSGPVLVIALNAD
jgi:hypothetical protein